MYFVYIIYSEHLNKYYKGFSTDVRKRIQQHNEGESRYTSRATDWEPIHLELFASKSDALKRERVLKKYDHQKIIRLSLSPKNQLKNYFNKFIIPSKQLALITYFNAAID